MQPYRLNNGVLSFAAFSCLSATALAQAPILTTRVGHEIGFSVSSYKYDEPALMSIKATKFGIDYAGTFNLGNNWFARAEARYANGKGEYSSTASGTMNNRPDRYTEIRGLIGKDYAYGKDTLSPYLGLGYRSALNDLRGISSTNQVGYRRETTYLTLPVGITHQMKLANQARLSSTVDFSYLLRGEAHAKYSDMVGYNGFVAAQDANHRQRRGYGLRLSVNYEVDKWIIGPFVNYWNIKSSDTVSVTRAVIGSVTQSSWEPANKTTEFGLKIGYRF